MEPVIHKIKKAYGKHIIAKLFFTILGLCVLIGILHYIPILGIKANKLPEISYKGLSKAGKELSHDAGEVLVAESDSKRLYIDSTTMNLKVEDKNTKKVWNALIPNSTDPAEQSLLSVSYLGNNNNLYEWDSYSFCKLTDSYNIYQIDNGVQIKMKFNEGESERFKEYYPDKMAIDRYEEFFIKGIDDKIASGELEKAAGEKYKLTLSLIYKKSTTENCYFVAYNGTPPRSAVKQLIQLAKVLGYTRDMLIADAAQMGLSVTFVEPSVLDITLEAKLDGDDFTVRIPSQEMVSENDYYRIQNIKVLPYFGAAGVKGYKDGYLLVPDGAGALFQFNTADAAVPDYSRPVYDNDYLKDYYYMPEYKQELMMPVFGMTYGEGGNSTHGFLGIIEEGAQTSYINAKLASTDKNTPSSYNRVYPSFDVTQYTNVNVYGPFSDIKQTYMAKTDMMEVDYSVRYELFPGKVTYYDMAKAYQNYLLKEWNISELSYPDQPKLYLDFIGTLSLVKRALGIPYDSPYSMTTYQELSNIIKDTGDMNLAIQYSGFFNGGLENKLNTKASLTKSNGTEKELNELRDLAKEKGIDLFFEAGLGKVFDKGNGFAAKNHAVYDYSNIPAAIYRYLPSIGIFDGASDYFEAKYFYLLSPRYLDGVTDKFLATSKTYDKLSIPDLAYYNFADYRYKKNITAYEASKIVEDNLKKLAVQKELSLYNPRLEALRYASYAENISRDSSEYATIYTTIPFRQLVMNGLVQVTTEDVNMSSYEASYYVLQSVELGVYPKFTLTAKSVDALKDSAYSYYYATEYEKQKETMNQVYQTCKEAWEKIGTMQITNHQILENNVFRTDYESKVSVITNYNLHSVVVDGKEIAALGYIILE